MHLKPPKQLEKQLGLLEWIMSWVFWSHTEIMKELHEKNESIIEILE